MLPQFIRVSLPGALRISARRPIGLNARPFQTIYQGAQYSHRTMSTLETNNLGDGASPIIYSANQPAGLPERVSNLSAWTVTPSKMGLVRQYTFPTFAAAWRFMSTVADECKAKRHHPSWHNLYNQVTVEWTTHNPKGLSIKDVEMAEFCDRVSEEEMSRTSAAKSDSKSN